MVLMVMKWAWLVNCDGGVAEIADEDVAVSADIADEVEVDVLVIGGTAAEALVVVVVEVGVVDGG
jgi:hypothetical protein